MGVVRYFVTLLILISLFFAISEFVTFVTIPKGATGIHITNNNDQSYMSEWFVFVFVFLFRISLIILALFLVCLQDPSYLIIQYSYGTKLHIHTRTHFNFH